MSDDERLICVECGEDLRIVSVGVGLGHVINPTFRSHYPVVRRPSAAGASIRGREDIQRQTGAVRHGTPDRRSPRAGRVVPNVSTPVTPRAFRGARVDGGTPPASSRSAERSTLT